MKIQSKPTKLAEVLTPVSRAEAVDPTKEYRLLGVRLEGGGPFLRETLAGSQSAATTLFQVKEDDFIYSRLFAWRGAFGVINADLDSCYVSGEFPTFRPIEAKIDLRFLAYWFRLPSTLERVEADCTGSTPLTRNRFKENFFLSLTIPLPPLAEQRRIVARIESLAAKIEEASMLRSRAAEEGEDLLNAKLDECIGAVAKEAELLAIGKAGGFVTSGPRGWGDYYNEDGDRRLIRVENVQDRNMDLSTAAKVSVPAHAGDLERSQVQRGDVLVTITGAIGRVGVVRDFDLPCHVSQHVALLRPPAKLSSDYLYWYLRSPSLGRSQTEGNTYGATKPGLDLTTLRELRIATPSPEEQRRIVAYLDDLQARVDTLKQLQAEAAAELTALFPSILDRAFKGEL